MDPVSRILERRERHRDRLLPWAVAALLLHAGIGLGLMLVARIEPPARTFSPSVSVRLVHLPGPRAPERRPRTRPRATPLALSTPRPEPTKAPRRRPQPVHGPPGECGGVRLRRGEWGGVQNAQAQQERDEREQKPKSGFQSQG